MLYFLLQNELNVNNFIAKSYIDLITKTRLPVVDSNLSIEIFFININLFCYFITKCSKILQFFKKFYR